MGYRLKRMPSRRLADTKTARILRLHRRGTPPAVIARRVGVNRQYIRHVVWQDWARKAGR
jgi:hypothetical protein